MLTIAQITDIHVGAGVDELGKARNVERLRETLSSIHRLQPRPAAIFATGDLVDNGLDAEYAELKPILAESEIPVYLAVGNHDIRDAFVRAFHPPLFEQDQNGFIQYARDVEGLRVITIDTLQEGAHGGAFCEARAAWLSAMLDALPYTPTLILAHHPPIVSGIQWMDPDQDSAWIGRLEAVLRGRRQVQTLSCGHLHRALARTFAGHVLSVAPATTLQLTLNLTDIDLEVPDHRELLVDEPPGFVVHAFDGRFLTTHICVAGHYASAVTYEKPFQRSH